MVEEKKSKYQNPIHSTVHYFTTFYVTLQANSEKAKHSILHIYETW